MERSELIKHSMAPMRVFVFLGERCGIKVMCRSSSSGVGDVIWKRARLSCVIMSVCDHRMCGFMGRRWRGVW